MANLPFEYHPAAVAEARHAYAWYAERSEQAAERFWQELVRARKLVVKNPLTWTPYFHASRVFQLRQFPYGLVYVVRPERIVGLAVCNMHRQPGYWLSRADK